jgi:hypothetical protein
MLDEWQAETDRLRVELGDLRGARDAAAPDTALFIKNQHAADCINYRWHAYQAAKPVLEKLWQQLEDAKRNERQDREDSHEIGGNWLRIAAFLAVASIPFLWLGSLGGWPWWIGLVLATASLASLGLSWKGYTLKSDPTYADRLDLRLDAIVEACQHVQTEADLEAVERMLEPTSASKPGHDLTVW